MSNKVFIGVVLLLVVLGGGFLLIQGKGGSPSTPQPELVTEEEQDEVEEVPPDVSKAKNEVEIKDFSFSSKSLTVKVGTVVTWTNQDITGHSATADDKSFDTGVLSQGESGSATFDKVGTFSYHCTPHPDMKATVVVEE